MRYCIRYNPNVKNKYYDEVDELMISYNRKDTTLLDFLLLHQEQRVNIAIEHIEDFLDNNCIEIFKEIKRKYPNLNFVFTFYYQEDKNEKLINILNDADMPFFFLNFVKDWDTLHFLKSFNPTDMYIVEALGFELVAVASVLAASDIAIRCFPNVAQHVTYTKKGLKSFFIRPEDVDFYEQYVHCLEFFGKEETLDVYYKVYKYDKKWFGKLKEIIIGLDSEIDSRNIPMGAFAQTRVSCGKRCLKGRPCQMCERIEQLSATKEKLDNKIAELKQNS